MVEIQQTLPKIRISKWDGSGKIVKEIEVQGRSLKECERLVDKYG